ncbi:hypothetical protein HRbin16_00326 [bacterium HR16]|nr:hypothetical protein HRbin16_00326 [bacterium HR16]
MRCGLLLMCYLLFAGCAYSTPVEDIRSQLLLGVTEIAAPGIPGPLVLTSTGAVPVVCAKAGEGVVEPVVAAVRWGKARAIVLGHPGYFGAEAIRTAATGTLLLNAVRWLSEGKTNARIGVYRQPDLLAFLQQKGVQAQSLDGEGWLKQLSTVRVLCCNPASLRPEEIQQVRRWARGGKGLLLADLGWGWLQLNPGKKITDHHGNLLLADAGVYWADGYLSTTSPGGYRTDLVPPAECHALTALQTLRQLSSSSDPTAQSRLRQAEWTLEQALRTVPSTQTRFLTELQKACAQVPHELLSLRKPVTQTEPLARLAIAVQTEQIKRLSPEKVKAHPSAQTFPGTVPADAPRVDRVISIDTRIPRWHSTGLYAAPGEVITVEIPPSAADKGLSVRIGVHTDTLWHLPKWERAPEISFGFPMKSAVTRVASAFGGAIVIEVPERCSLGTVTVTIRGAVEAPYFVRGKTDIAAWRRTIRHAPAPWAELQGKRVILSVPSRVVRTLDDPESLLEFWDAVADACADLAGIPAERPYPERYVCDRQISAGYMHSGYPIMTWMDVADLVVDLPRLRREGSWGHFHEIGHNHQRPDWTFEGTGEVTVNLFSMYIYHKVLGQPFDQGHPAIRDRQKRLQRAREYIARGARFEEWKNDPFLALTMYIQIIEEFGWEPVKRVIAEYRQLPPEERPHTDAQKRDQWMMRLSRAVGRNLAPFFDTWGVPISQEARDAVKHLPVWIPSELQE